MVVAVLLITIALFVILTLFMVIKPDHSVRVSKILFVILTVMGLLTYGYGFATLTGDYMLSVVRAIISVVRMFTGDPDVEEISRVPLMQNSWMQLLLWLIHLLAIYTTVSVAVNVLGAKALRKLRLRISRKQPLNLIYGVGEETQELGKYLLQNKGAVVYVGEAEHFADAIFKAGGLLRTDENALMANRQFLKSVGATGKDRKITLYALNESATENLQYARKLLDAMENCGIRPEQTDLVIRTRENSAVTSLQVLGDTYGYGGVTVVQEAALAARTLIKEYPPCDHISFDETGRAAEDFEALVIGFGQVGQNVLRYLVMNGQFEGSHFRAAVFAPDCSAVKGHFDKSNAYVLKSYDIRFFDCDARSGLLYDYLEERGGRIKYLAVCTGSDKMNHEIAEDVTEFLHQKGICLSAYLCSHRGVQRFDPENRIDGIHTLYDPEVLSMEKMDHMAMCVNSAYIHDDSKTPLQHWRWCDYFSRMSCRATADFIPAMLKMAGTTREQVLTAGWKLTPEQLENLSRTEHLRWCAFHYCMGFAPMEKEEYDRRAETYRSQLAAGQKPLRIGKNMQARTHACLISWEELDALSRTENEITGRPVDYKEMDRQNVMLIPELLRIEAKNGEVPRKE